MKKMKKIISLLVIAAMICTLFIGCSSNNTGVSTDGSTSMSSVIGALSEVFENDTGISVTYNATGSGSGIQAVKEGRCDIGLSSRNLKDEEKQSGLVGTVLAYDGILDTDSARIRLTVLTPNAAMIAIASKILGTAFSTSMKRMIVLSVFPP